MTDLERIGLADNPNITIVHFGNEDEWKELRTRGIGGSDAGAIMGLNKYESPLTVYKKKVEGYEEDLSDNVYVRKGKALEDLILREYVTPKMTEMGYSHIEKPDFMMINEACPWLRANVDGIASDPKNPTIGHSIIIEIKCVSEYAEINWDGPEYCGIPASYYAQVQHYMAVTGCNQAILCALFDRTWEMHYYNIPRDDEFIDKMLTMTKAFYEYNMMTEIPPRATFSMDKEYIAEKVKTVEEPKTPDAEMTKLVNDYLTLSDKIKAAEKKKENLETLIFDKYSKGFCPDDPTRKVKFTTVKSTRFNSTKFKAEHEAVYKQYLEESESVRKTIK